MKEITLNFLLLYSTLFLCANQRRWRQSVNARFLELLSTLSTLKLETILLEGSLNIMHNMIQYLHHQSPPCPSDGTASNNRFLEICGVAVPFPTHVHITLPPSLNKRLAKGLGLYPLVGSSRMNLPGHSSSIPGWPSHKFF